MSEPSTVPSDEDADEAQASSPSELPEPSAILADARKRWHGDDHDGAIALLTDHTDDDAALLNELGYMQLRVGRLEEARANLEKAAGLDMDEELRAKVHHNLGLLRNREAARRNAACTDTTRVVLRPSEDRADRYDLDDSEGLLEMGETEALRATWRGDLNADGHVDLILHQGECGNYRDCVFGVYAGCGGDEYAVVWGPEYAQAITVGSSSDQVDGAAWKRLEIEGRDTTVKPAEQFYKETARFNGSRYTK